MSVGAVSAMGLPAGGSVMHCHETVAPAIVQMPPVAVQAVPRYHHAAGSCEVPVYGTSVAVPTFYQQSGSRLPTTNYSDDTGLSHEQMKTIFPLGAPEGFRPFEPSRCLYNIVESAEHCLPVAAPDTVVDSNLTVATPSVAEAGTPTPAMENATRIEAGAADKPLHGKKRSTKKKTKQCC
mmetsp:Transcript_79955/g.154535  ORF Transcript_79955/g.154535 Transcript_79955/m.154535 type:complete len:180 (+) Transcript_79955:48-587(+)|eukprot:CAMPEP_0172720140 /NCGR_PEP_ID=MMETSP1074-20121228/76215_1 /TAXON_ID=2916 /ORGANISM="Ceratium fusus, Strain PA161109" /LENGTH=179 /DNA_ID=CAMNT_0013545589 /DNA_START=41 /DNA_END=580 /DNA_ORIENTATION=-